MSLVVRSTGRFSACLLLFVLCVTLDVRTAFALPSMLPAGTYHTSGSQIVDQDGDPVRLSCIYWQGMNILDGPLHSVTAPYSGLQANMNAIAAAGFDCVRVDWNNASLHAGSTAAFLQEMDQVVATAGAANLKVIFVDHDNEGLADMLSGRDCASQQHNGLWYDLGGASDGTDGCNHPGSTTQASFQADWSFVAARYAGNDSVIGYDVWNEPFTYGSSTWGDGTPHDIRKMYQDVGSAILAYDSGKLIFAECPQNHGPTLLFDKQTISYAPWGDCTGARYQPIVFNANSTRIDNQVVYTVHLYPSSISGIANIFGSSAALGIVTAMNASFGFLVKGRIAPVWQGEGGSGFYASVDDQAWANMLVQYLNGQLGAQGAPTYTGNQQGMGFAWMDWGTSYGPTSDDVGILNRDGSLNAGQFNIVRQMDYYPKAIVRACTPSPPNTFILKGAGTVIDSYCNGWTIAPDGHVAMNGVERVGSFSAIAIGYNKSIVTFENTSRYYYRIH